jgi:hypothetical protein
MTAPSHPSKRACASRPTAATVPDQAGRERIVRELDRCLLVEAGAGVGKTERLVARMVELLASGLCATQTLAAITFTRKAAAELRARFQVALEQAARAEAGERRRRLADALAHVEQAFVGTIHSFCGRLLRERPVEAGVDLAFTETDDAADARLRRQAWDDYVANLHLTGDPLLAGLEERGLKVGHLADAFVRFADYADVTNWPAPEAPLPDLDKAAEALRAYARHMQPLARSLPADPGEDRLAQRYRLVPRLVRQADLRRPASLMDVLDHFEEMGPHHVRFRAWPEGAGQARSELARWNLFCARHAAPCREAWRAARYGSVLRVLRGARDAYDRRRATLGCLSYQDLLLRAAALLRGRPEVRRYFRTRFTHLLVDEFQDTDPVQAEVMLLLTADDPTQDEWRRCRPVPGALFVVGDPKQSIYRFRRADVVTYNQVKQVLRGAGGDVVELWTSYRIDRAPTYLLVDRQGRVVPRRDRGAFSSVPTAEEIKEHLGQVGGDGAENRGVPEGIIVWKQDKLVFLTAEGKEIKAVSLPNEAKGLHSLAVSPDRKRVALVASELPPVDRDGNYMRHVLIWDLAGAGKPSQLDLKAQNLAWTATGKLLVVEAASRKDLKEKKFTTSLVNPTTNKAEGLELPAGVQALAAMPDEKSFVARAYDAEKGQSYLDLIGRDGKRIDRLTEVIDREIGLIFRAPVLSPDGSRLLFTDADLKAKLEEGMPRLPQLFVYDIKAKKRERLADVPLNAFILGYAWSPDSRKVAYAWKRVEPGVPIVSNSSNKDDPKRMTETESFVVVADANGGNAKTVHSAKGPTGPTITIRDLDWR